MEIRRDFSVLLERRLAERPGFIQIVIGPRQVGKTTGVRQIVERRRGSAHVASADAVISPSPEWVEIQWKQARSRTGTTLLVLDEIQKVPGWSTVVKRLYDEDRRERRLLVVLLGSASLTLQRGLGESLAGRYELVHATHWSLPECRRAFKWSMRKFLKFGGYPAAAELIHDIPRWQAYIREAIIEPVLIKDLLSLAPVIKPALFRQTFHLAVSYPAQIVSLQKMLGQLQDSGNVTTIKHYLEMFEGAGLIRCLQKFSGSAIRTRGSSPKLLPLNNALLHAFRDPGDVEKNPEWLGRVLECTIGASLAQSGGELFYWREGQAEVDFVLQRGKRLYAIEVKSGSVRRASRGLEVFIRQNPSAIPVVVDMPMAEQLLETGDPEKAFDKGSGPSFPIRKGFQTMGKDRAGEKKARELSEAGIGEDL